METDTKTQTETKNQRPPNADMWQLRKTHTPKRTNPNQAHNQPIKKYSTTKQQTIANAKQKTQPPTAPDALMMSIEATPSSNCLKNKFQQYSDAAFYRG
jgi:hypothetical protein